MYKNILFISEKTKDLDLPNALLETNRFKIDHKENKKKLDVIIRR